MYSSAFKESSLSATLAASPGSSGRSTGSWEAMREAHRKNGFLDELAKRWDRLIEKSPPVPSPQGLSPQSLGGDPKPLDLATEFFRDQVSPQATLPGQCLSWFLWACTAYRNAGYVSFTASTNTLPGDFRNQQNISYPWYWRGTPKQVYTNPLNAPSRATPTTPGEPGT